MLTVKTMAEPSSTEAGLAPDIVVGEAEHVGNGVAEEEGEMLGVEEVEEVKGGREGAVSPQFSTTSTVSGGLDDTNPFTGSNASLEQNGDGAACIAQTQPSGEPDERIAVSVDTTGGVQGGETVVAMTTGTWERFEPAASKSLWETFEASGEGGEEEGGEGQETVEVEVHASAADVELNAEGGEAGVEGGDVGGATATSSKTTPSKPAAQSADDPGAVCAADALVSTGWTALGDNAGQTIDTAEEDYRNLPFRQTRSMRATTNRKVQIVDALKQQRRLSNTSLDREPSKGGMAFANEDELSRRYNVEREWQVFVKMNKRVPGTR